MNRQEGEGCPAHNTRGAGVPPAPRCPMLQHAPAPPIPQPAQPPLHPAAVLPDMIPLLTAERKTEQRQQGKRKGIVFSTSQLSGLGKHFCLEFDLFKK